MGLVLFVGFSSFSAGSAVVQSAFSQFCASLTHSRSCTPSPQAGPSGCHPLSAIRDRQAPASASMRLMCPDPSRHRGHARASTGPQRAFPRTGNGSLVPAGCSASVWDGHSRPIPSRRNQTVSTGALTAFPTANWRQFSRPDLSNIVQALYALRPGRVPTLAQTVQVSASSSEVPRPRPSPLDRGLRGDPDRKRYMMSCARSLHRASRAGKWRLRLVADLVFTLYHGLSHPLLPLPPTHVCHKPSAPTCPTLTTATNPTAPKAANAVSAPTRSLTPHLSKTLRAADASSAADRRRAVGVKSTKAKSQTSSVRRPLSL